MILNTLLDDTKKIIIETWRWPDDSKEFKALCMDPEVTVGIHEKEPKAFVFKKYPWSKHRLMEYFERRG